MILGRKRIQPSSFFYSFKRDASANTASIWNSTTTYNTYDIGTKNETNRNIFFSIFSETSDKESMTELNFYRAFQLSNLFVNIIPTENILSSSQFTDKLISLYNLIQPPISIKQRSNFQFYKELPRDIYIDILIFLSIENYSIKFESVLKSNNKLLSETQVRFLIMDFGMREMPETVFDLAKKGFDNLRRRTYDPHEMFKNCIKVQAAAAEAERSRELLHRFNLPATSEESRRYPDYPRRNQISEYV